MNGKGMRGMEKLRRFRTVLLAAVLGMILYGVSVSAYEHNNDFIPDAFPKETSRRVFSLRLDPGTVMVIHPSAAEPLVDDMRHQLGEKCGSDISFRKADDLTEDDLRGRDLIILGNIGNNRWAFDLYRQRFAFADAYFPGAGGVVITPAESIWDRERNIIVIGVSRDEDLAAGFAAFVEMVERGAKTVGPVRVLRTPLSFPKPPASVSAMFANTLGSLSASGTTSWAVPSSSLDDSRKNVRAVMAPYTIIANWGLAYHVSGDRKWAENFLEGMRFCHERARLTGQWIPEPWTNVYFCLWKMVQAWELIDDDPFFTPEDRKLIDEVLWGYTRFCNWLPNLDRDQAPPDEPRQNHTTFLALSLYNAHRYFAGKYAITGLESLERKYRNAFDTGAASSFRPNDDAGGYLNLAPLHLLYYQMKEGNFSFAGSDRMGRLADLIALTMDNRGDPVGFGDVGGYSHRKKGSPRGMDAVFFGMAARFTGDGEYRWLYDWSTGRESVGREGDLAFNLDELYTGCYAVESPRILPTRLLGVHPMFLDEGALRWSARRSWKNDWIPRTGTPYLDKLTFRSGFGPGDEYLLLDGTSTFSHGHYDGNTVARLTWKDRIWLFETDYIRLTPRYHNGIVITRDGVQEEPAPLTTLDYAADFPELGISGSTSPDFNGADWTRSILWRRGRWFLVLDRVKALREGEYRLERRWRSRGEISLAGNRFSARQGDAALSIMTADDAPRRVEYEPDVFLSTWNYPYGDGRLGIDYSRRDVTLARDGEYTFSSLLSVTEDEVSVPPELFRTGNRAWVIRDGSSSELVSLDPAILGESRIAVDCALFDLDAGSLTLAGVTSFRAGNLLLEAPGAVNLRFDLRKSAGLLIVPESVSGTFRLRGLTLSGVTISGAKAELAPGTYRFTLAAPLPDLKPLLARYAASARTVQPDKWFAPQVDFGFGERRTVSVPDTVTAFCPDGDGLVLGDGNGGISRFDGETVVQLGRVESGRPVTVIYTADLDDDGSGEIIAGDDREGLFCFDSAGKPRWKRALSKYYGPNANVTSLAAAKPENFGKTVLFAATQGWKLYAVEPDGKIRWEGFSYYHPMTKVAYLDNGPGESLVAAGTRYQTPLNVFSASTGENRWFTWEEMGSEFISSTQYCGIHLTDMVFLDVDGCGKKEIVFGTKYNTVYALKASDGSCVWEANVGDEVAALRVVTNHAHGKPEILVATGAGDLVRLDRSGQRLGAAGLDAEGIVSLEVMAHPEHKRNDIVVALRDGRVLVCDDSFLVRASASLGVPLNGLALGGERDGVRMIYAVSGPEIRVLGYYPYFLRKMRTD